MKMDENTQEAALDPEDVGISLESHDAGIVAVDSEDIGISLPDAEEMKTAAGSTGQDMVRLYKIIGIVSVCLLVLIIGVSVGVSGKKSSASASEVGGGAKVYLVDNGHDGTGSLERYNVAYHFLTEVSSPDDLKIKGTPQNLAANWIANTDSKKIAVPDILDSIGGFIFTQRYVLTVMYYHLGGRGWLFKSRFLTKEHECDWNLGVLADDHGYKFGASCGDGNSISEIFMRTFLLSDMFLCF